MLNLPEHYHDDRFVVIVRDPTTLFAYWDLKDQMQSALSDRLGKGTLAKSTWVIRLINCTTGESRDEVIDPQVRNWYLSVPSNCRYQAKLGITPPDGRFLPIFSGGPVQTPPLTFSQLYDRQWMVLEEDYLRLLALGWEGYLGSSGLVPKEEESAWVTFTPPPLPAEEKGTSPGVPAYKDRR